ncbi:MAG: GNAT family N-acetyltransferase, partial [Hungatella sp.]
MMRLAEEKDLVQIDQIYEEILDYEAETVSYTNWQKGLYPTLAYAKTALDQRTLYVGEDGDGVYGCVILNAVQPDEYGEIDWQIAAKPEEVIVIHTLCVRP